MGSMLTWSLSIPRDLYLYNSICACIIFLHLFQMTSRLANPHNSDYIHFILTMHLEQGKWQVIPSRIQSRRKRWVFQLLLHSWSSSSGSPLPSHMQSFTKQLQTDSEQKKHFALANVRFFLTRHLGSWSQISKYTARVEWQPLTTLERDAKLTSSSGHLN